MLTLSSLLVFILMYIQLYLARMPWTPQHRITPLPLAIIISHQSIATRIFLLTHSHHSTITTYQPTGACPSLISHKLNTLKQVSHTTHKLISRDCNMARQVKILLCCHMARRHDPIGSHRLRVKAHLLSRVVMSCLLKVQASHGIKMELTPQTQSSYGVEVCRLTLAN